MDRYERAQVLQWLMFEQYTHEPYIAVARFWALSVITPATSSELGEGARRPRGAQAPWTVS